MKLTSLFCVPPACDPDGLASREDMGSIRQADGAHDGAVLHRLLQLQQGDVIVEGEIIEGRVGDDTFELQLLHPRGTALALVQSRALNAANGLKHSWLLFRERTNPQSLH